MSAPKIMKWNTETFLFIYLFIYLLDTTLQHLEFNVFFPKY